MPQPASNEMIEAACDAEEAAATAELEDAAKRTYRVMATYADDAPETLCVVNGIDELREAYHRLEAERLAGKTVATGLYVETNHSVLFDYGPYGTHAVPLRPLLTDVPDGEDSEHERTLFCPELVDRVRACELWQRRFRFGSNPLDDMTPGENVFLRCLMIAAPPSMNPSMASLFHEIRNGRMGV